MYTRTYKLFTPVCTNPIAEPGRPRCLSRFATCGSTSLAKRSSPKADACLGRGEWTIWDRQGYVILQETHNTGDCARIRPLLQTSCFRSAIKRETQKASTVATSSECMSATWAKVACGQGTCSL